MCLCLLFKAIVGRVALTGLEPGGQRVAVSRLSDSQSEAEPPVHSQLRIKVDSIQIKVQDCPD